MQTNELTIKRTATGWWTVQRGQIHVAGAWTRDGAERERELLKALSQCSERRAGARTGAENR